MLNSFQHPWAHLSKPSNVGQPAATLPASAMDPETSSGWRCMQIRRMAGGLIYLRFSSGRSENWWWREPARSVLQYVSTGSAERRDLQPGMGPLTGMKVGRFCCPARPQPLNSLLLPGGFNRVLAL